MVLNDLISDSIDRDSQDEEYFEWYLNDLLKAGFIKDYFRSSTINLTPGIAYEYTQQLKSKEKELVRVVAPNLVFTPDYTIVWNTKAENVFYHRYDIGKPIEKDLDKPKLFPMMLAKEIESKEIVSLIDVKPDIQKRFNTFGSSATFVIKQALLYEKYNIIVDKVKVKSLMKATFTSTRYMLTDKSLKPRKINWDVKTLKEHLNKINTIRNEYCNR